jgi:branched-chain amino acid transport system substrate-binding protein
MARDEINAAGGVTVNGTDYTIQLVEVETAESTEMSGLTGKANLLAVIDDVDFCVGGFRTECVQVYKDVAMEAKKVFMNCGAATGSLQFDVVENYSKNKYWFKSTPYNESFLVKSCLKMTKTIGGVLNATLKAYNATLLPAYQTDASYVAPRVEIIMENAAWCAVMYAVAQMYLPAMGFNVTGAQLVSPTATDISTELNAIKSRSPHIIFTAFSGSVGATYSIQKNALDVPGMTIGINVPGQQLVHWVNTGGKCEGEVMLDTWAENVAINTGTVAWFNAYVTRFSRYPVYTASTYDAVKYVCSAMEATNSFDSDTLVAWLEANPMTNAVASPTVKQYPAPLGVINSTMYYLTAEQVYALYPNINSTFIRFNLTSPYFHVVPGGGYWMYDWFCADPTSNGPHIQHDLVYGPGLVTGIGSQWQSINGSGHKVGVWPLYLGAANNIPLTDQYGCWNFNYTGTVMPTIPVASFQP